MHYKLLGFSIPLMLVLFTSPLRGQDRVDRSNESLSLAQVIEADIRDAVRLAGAEIDVTADDGRVTLSGTVNSIFDKKMAARIAKRTRGVQVVLNQVVIAPSDRSDEAIRSDVMNRLRINQATDRPQLTVQVSSGVVAIVGEVDSLAEKRIAELAASGVRGVTRVNNDISVAISGDRDDRDIREEIRNLFVHSVYLDDVDLEVQIEGTTAKLSGSVQSLAQLDHAKGLASVLGIGTVDVVDVEIDPESGDPSLREQRYATVTDETIKNALQAALAADPVVFDSRNRILIAVNNGVVTLTGKVDSLREKHKAKDLAIGVVGTVRVINELNVQRPENAPSDMEIIRETQEALRLSPYLERRSLRVHCQRAHLTLYGVVDSELEKQVAGWIADDITGVVHVNNALAVEPKPSDKTDEQIKSDLERKLKYTLLANAKNIDVTVEDGVAILRGEVDTWRQWQAAMELALEAGARHPHNLINVRLHPPHGAPRSYIP